MEGVQSAGVLLILIVQLFWVESGGGMLVDVRTLHEYAYIECILQSKKDD